MNSTLTCGLESVEAVDLDGDGQRDTLVGGSQNSQASGELVELGVGHLGSCRRLLGQAGEVLPTEAPLVACLEGLDLPIADPPIQGLLTPSSSTAWENSTSDQHSVRGFRCRRTDRSLWLQARRPAGGRRLGRRGFGESHPPANGVRPLRPGGAYPATWRSSTPGSSRYSSKSAYPTCPQHPFEVAGPLGQRCTLWVQLKLPEGARAIPTPRGGAAQVLVPPAVRVTTGPHTLKVELNGSVLEDRACVSLIQEWRQRTVRVIHWYVWP